jgi:hypothetical protein
MHRKSMEVVQKHQRGMNSQTSDSSTSSTAPVMPRGEGAVGRDGMRIGGGRAMAGPLSPKRTSALSGKGREGSEGSPSMGSSFSDLDGKFSYVWCLCWLFGEKMNFSEDTIC